MSYIYFLFSASVLRDEDLIDILFLIAKSVDNNFCPVDWNKLSIEEEQIGKIRLKFVRKINSFPVSLKLLMSSLATVYTIQ